MKRIKALIIISLFAISGLTAQRDDNIVILPPKSVKATDSTLEKKVEITWQSLGKDYKYWVVRANSLKTSVRDATPISHGWQYANNMTDYNVESGKPYFYYVKAQKQGKESAYSAVVRGSAIAFAGSKGKNNELTQQQKGGATLLDSVRADMRLPQEEFVLSNVISLGYILENTQKQTINDLKIQFYLSKDETLSENDGLLATETINVLEGFVPKRSVLQIRATPSVSTGTYWLLLTIESSKKVLATKRITFK